MKSFQDQLKVCLSRYLEANKITIYKVAQESGISYGSLNGFRNGKCGLSMESLDKLAAAIDARVVLAPVKEEDDGSEEAQAFE